MRRTGRDRKDAVRKAAPSPRGIIVAIVLMSAALGFVPRVDIREVGHRFEYRFRPETRIVSIGPTGETSINWDRTGRVQDCAFRA